MSNEKQANGLAIVDGGNTELANVNAQLPDFMAAHGGAGTETLRQYIRPSRVKIVQYQSLGIFKEQFSPGDVVLVPQLIQLIQYNKQNAQYNRLWFTPLFFFAEYLLVNPIELKGSEPFVVDRTTNVKSELARRAKSERERTEDYPGKPQYKRKYVEALNFVSIVHIQGFEATPVVFSFSNAEHKSGETLAAHITMRRQGQVRAPLYGCVFQGEVRDRRNTKGEWLGFDISNPTADSGFAPFIMDQALFNQYAALHEELATAFNEQRLDIDYEDAEAPVDANNVPRDVVNGAYADTQPAF